ncbi:hypothetical protein BH11ACT1_BH11ACT1_19200 [soil metagenome]
MAHPPKTGVTPAREGQAVGTVTKGRGTHENRGNQWASGRGDGVSSSTPSVEDIAPDFYNNGSAIGHLSGDFTDEEFDGAATVQVGQSSVASPRVRGAGAGQRAHICAERG